jgi:peptidoglycan/xylan/chitin deacetylase (PgdA/CDA1 family)
MRTYPVKTPGIIQSIFGKYRWRFQTDKKATNAQNKKIYLTFDDGPIPEITPWVLQNLSKYKAKATFFCIGENVKRHPKIFQKIIFEKHSIGNHTYNHLDGWKTNKKEYLNNVEKAEGIFRSQFREEEKDERGGEKDEREEKNQQADNSHKLTVNIFRPPYGKIKIDQSNKILKKGYDIIMWDVLSGDFDLSLSKEKCLKNVLKNTRSGSIVVFHDSTKAFKNLEYVLPKVLEYFTEKGYVFKSI